MSYASAIDRARAKLSSKGGKFLPDVCTIKRPNSTEARNARGEVTTSDTNLATDVPVKYEALSTFERMTGGEVTAQASHRLTLPANATTLTIGGGDRVEVQARGVTPTLLFEVTGRLDSSTSLMLMVAAVLR